MTPYIAQLCKNYGIHPIIGCSLILLIGIPLGMTLRESLGTDIDADIIISDKNEAITANDEYSTFSK